jgi:hypothetical protein
MEAGFSFQFGPGIRRLANDQGAFLPVDSLRNYGLVLYQPLRYLLIRSSSILPRSLICGHSPLLGKCSFSV